MGIIIGIVMLAADAPVLGVLLLPRPISGSSESRSLDDEGALVYTCRRPKNKQETVRSSAMVQQVITALCHNARTHQPCC